MMTSHWRSRCRVKWVHWQPVLWVDFACHNVSYNQLNFADDCVYGLCQMWVSLMWAGGHHIEMIALSHNIYFQLSLWRLLDVESSWSQTQKHLKSYVFIVSCKNFWCHPVVLLAVWFCCHCVNRVVKLWICLITLIMQTFILIAR